MSASRAIRNLCTPREFVMTKSNVPNLTTAQRAEALAKAAQARHDRAQLRDDPPQR